MKHIVTKTLCVVAVLFAMNIGVSGHPQNVDTRIGRLDLELGVPTKETVAKLYDDMDFQRACQLYVWALPLVNAYQGTLSFMISKTPGVGPVLSLITKVGAKDLVAEVKWLSELDVKNRLDGDYI